MPLDAPSGEDPAVRLARRIAGMIARLAVPRLARTRARRDNAAGRGAIAPGDIMILVRARGAFFEAMIRALKEADVKAAGADRLAL